MSYVRRFTVLTLMHLLYLFCCYWNILIASCARYESIVSAMGRELAIMEIVLALVMDIGG